MKGALGDSAKKLIQSIPISEDSYDRAWVVLSQRYENKWLLVATYAKQFLAIPQIQKASAANYRTFIDTATDCTTTLEMLGYPVHECVLSVVQLAQKLDNQARYQWELTLTDDTVPTFERLIKFVEQRAKSLHVISSDNSTFSYSSSRPPARTTHAHLSTQDSCEGYGASHSICTCESFIKLLVEKRIEFAKSRGLCFNCLQRGHIVGNSVTQAHVKGTIMFFFIERRKARQCKK